MRVRPIDSINELTSIVGAPVIASLRTLLSRSQLFKDVKDLHLARESELLSFLYELTAWEAATSKKV
jgi:hypothetical protein